MKLAFIGADHEVTGSCHYLEVCGKHILVDYGMEQGENIFENQEIPVSPSEIDYVLITHAHIDHTGLLPLLYKRGFQGQVFATKATVDLCNIMLRDSAHIQMFEAEWRNRKAQRSGAEEFVPLYTMEDADGVLKHFVPCEYGSIIELCPGVKIRFQDVGHLLGSASIEIWMVEGAIERKIVFSGDLGNINQPIIKDPSYVKEADYVVMESTYGNRYHGERPDYIGCLTEILNETFAKGGNVVIPSFAVGRTQEMLYFMRKIKEEHLVPNFDNFEVYVDSPLAVQATSIFSKNVLDCFDDEAMELVKRGVNPITFPGLKISITSDDSKAINFDDAPKVILSASGMCEAGRIRHHLKHNLWRSECTILFVGYQAVGTLGRMLIEGADEVKLFGEPVEVKARIETLAGISGHADKKGLIDWVTHVTPKPEKIFVVHGEDSVTMEFSDCLRTEYGLDAEAPYSGSSFDLAKKQWLEIAQPVVLKKKESATKRAKSMFERLLSAGQRLLSVIHKNEGMSNKDMAKFANQINSLCDKWDD